jgi:hypothetical protein
MSQKSKNLSTKATDKLVVCSATFIVGCLVTYYFCQIKYLEINRQVNVVESLIALLSIIIGIYIVVVLQRKQNINQNHYNFLVNRLDPIWSEYNGFLEQISQSDTVELKKLQMFIKHFQSQTNEMGKLLDSLKIENNFYSLSETFRDLLEKSLHKNNIIFYDKDKDSIVDAGKKVSDEFVRVYLSLNQKS